MRTAVLDSVLVTADDVFSDARRLAFSGIELTLERAKLRSAGADAELARLRRAAEQSSLDIHALVLAEHNHGGIAATSAGTASAAVRDVEAAIEWAAALGAEVVLVPFFLEADLRSDADFDRCADAFAALCPLAERRGVTLCYEGLYTLRFYDWLRRDLEGKLRPVHVDHAFANLDPRRRGSAVAELMPEPRTIRDGPGFTELELGRHPDLFFAVHRLDFADEVEDDARSGFHVLNLVAGEAVELESEAGDVHPLAYGETIVVPAAVGRYRIRRARGGACKVVKAFVP